MRSMATVLGLLVVVGSGYFVYNNYLSRRDLSSGAPPQQQIDVVGVQSDLLSMAQAERQYLVAHGTYGTLEQLIDDGLLAGGTERRGYTYTATVDGATAFTITGVPTASDKSGWPTVSIDQTLQLTRH